MNLAYKKRESRVLSPIVGSLVCAALVGAPAVAAQSPQSPDAGSAPAVASAPATAPAATVQVVLLKDGTEFRGTLRELAPDSHLILVLENGEARRFELKDVARVEAAGAGPGAAPVAGTAPAAPKPTETLAPGPTGPKSAAPKTPARSEPEREKLVTAIPMVTVHGERARLRFTSEQPGLTLHIGTGVERSRGAVVGITPYPYGDWFIGSVDSVGDRFDRVCTAPCEASLPAGNYVMALSTPEKDLLVLDRPVQVTGSGTLRGAYRSNAGIRTAGWITGGSALALGLALTIIGYADRSDAGDCRGGPCEEEANSALVISGVCVVFAGMLAGAIMVSIDDEASLQYAPETGIRR